MLPPAKFMTGFRYPWLGARFILKHPGLYKYIFVPLLINLLVFSMAAYWGLNFYGGLIGKYVPQSDAWYWLLLYYILWIFAILLAAVLVFFTFTVIGNLIASPFNDILSEKTEDLLKGATENATPFSIKLFLKESAQILLDEIRKMSLFVGCMVLLFFLNAIPVIGVLLYSVLSFLLTTYFLVVEYTGFVFSRKNLGFKNQRKFISQRKMVCAGFGCSAFLLLAIPFVQFFSIPMGVVGATILYHDALAPHPQQ